MITLDDLPENLIAHRAPAGGEELPGGVHGRVPASQGLTVSVPVMWRKRFTSVKS